VLEFAGTLPPLNPSRQSYFDPENENAEQALSKAQLEPHTCHARAVIKNAVSIDQNATRMNTKFMGNFNMYF